jgi:hypothetical protein
MTYQYWNKPHLFRVVESINGKTGPVSIKSSSTVQVINDDNHITLHAEPVVGAPANGEMIMF